MAKKPNTPICNLLDDLKNAGAKSIHELETLHQNQDGDTIVAEPPSTPLPSSKVRAHGLEEVILIDPHRAKNWDYSDRPKEELGDIQALAEEFKTIGQQQPCIVRLSKDPSKFQYEIIAGERRWHAAKEADIKLKVIVRNIDDNEAALCQAAENSHRKDLSEYAKGVSYAKLIDKGIINRIELQDKLKLSKSSIRNLLSFSKIDQEIWDSIGDYSNISAATAYEMSRLLSDTSKNYKAALIAIGPKISGTNISDKKLRQLVETALSDKQPRLADAIEVKTKDGRHIFTWRRDTNGNRSIAFPKDTREIIDFEWLEKSIVKNLEEQFLKKLEKLMDK